MNLKITVLLMVMSALAVGLIVCGKFEAGCTLAGLLIGLLLTGWWEVRHPQEPNFGRCKRPWLMRRFQLQEGSWIS